MINKQKIQEYINNEYIQYSTLIEYSPGGEDFYIFESRNQIRQLMLISQNINSDDNRVCYQCKEFIDSCSCIKSSSPYYAKQNTLNLGELLGLINSSWIYPLNIQDLEQIKGAIELFELLNNGQLILNGLNNLAPDPDQYIDNNHTDIDTLNKILEYYQGEGGGDLDNLNEWIKDQIESIEWGFNDEYDTCSECINSFRTSPDSYSWTKSYIDLEYVGYICSECANNYLEDFIQESQVKIMNGNPVTFPDIFDLGEEWIQIVYPSPYSFSKWESSMHEGGGKDSPKKQGRILKSIKLKGFKYPLLDCIFKIYPGQFDIEWDIYIRLNPDFYNEYEYKKGIPPSCIKLDKLSIRLGELLQDQGRDKFSPGDLYSKALKNLNTGKKFNSISIDTESGAIDIKSTDNLDEYLNYR